MRRVLIATGVLSIGLTACAAHPSAGPAAPSQVTTNTPSINAQPTTAPAQPKTLEAATAADQEVADRYSSGDYAGAWEMKTKDFQNHISKADYVKFNETCTRTKALYGTPIKVIGVRLEGSDTAIVRWEALGILQQSYSVVYEDGQWKDAPTDWWVNNYGKPIDQVIADAKAAGSCGQSGG